MARQRFIHPDIWADPTLGKLTAVERLLFIGCFSNADDEGRLLGNAAYLRSTIFPYDDFTISQVAEMRDHLVDICRNIAYYTADGVEYLAFLKWAAYQKPKYPKPSKFPSPIVGDVEETFTEDSSKTVEASSKLEKALPPRLGLGLDRVGLDSESQPPDGGSDKFDESHPAMQLAEHLRSCILNRDPNTKMPTSLQGWATEADRLLRVDKRLFEEARDLVAWCQNDAFWSANILSMGTFRKQYDKLKRKAQGGQSRAAPVRSATSVDRMRAYEGVLQRG